MSDIVDELTELNTVFSLAELSADVEFFRCYLADGLRFRRASGTVVDKVTFLKDLATPGNANERLEPRHLEVLPFGADLAVCSVVIDFKGLRGGSNVEGLYRNTRVFVRNEGAWKCALWFNSKEPKPA